MIRNFMTKMLTVTNMPTRCLFQLTKLRYVAFFYCYGYHRDLHSFPTRRSSDLPGSCLLLGPGSPCSLGRGECTVDRKSTRLNSSHTVISYAVLCLKKKKDIASLHGVD